MKQQSIIMIGPYPPPIGGVSIHLTRLVKKIEKTKKIYKINTSANFVIEGLKLIYAIFISKLFHDKQIVHNHVLNTKFSSFVAMLCKILKLRYIQSIHSLRIDVNEISVFDKWLLNRIIHNSHKIIAVNQEIKDKLILIGGNSSAKIHVIPAFLPSDKANDEFEDEKYINNLGINSFLDSHEIILAANAYKIVSFRGEDLYGIDLCIELMKRLKSSTSIKIGFVFMLPQIGDFQYYEELKSRVSKYDLDYDFIFVNKKVELVPLFRYIDIFIRPTNTDGDSISIREALYEGVVTIASDVVARPTGTVLFGNRDIDDLYEVVMSIITKRNNARNNIELYKKEVQQWLEGYEEIYNYK